MTIKGIACPVGHTTIWRKGLVPTRRGKKMRYTCSTCGRTFYGPKPGEKKKKGGK